MVLWMFFEQLSEIVKCDVGDTGEFVGVGRVLGLFAWDEASFAKHLALLKLSDNVYLRAISKYKMHWCTLHWDIYLPLCDKGKLQQSLSSTEHLLTWYVHFLLDDLAEIANDLRREVVPKQERCTDQFLVELDANG
jgi:hypothetical protein